jgi:WD40 repeat protein
VWSLRGPPSADPLRLGVAETFMREGAFTPDSGWLATAADCDKGYQLALWPMSDVYPRVLRSEEGPVEGRSLRFHPDGSRLLAVIQTEDGGNAVSWPLQGGAGREPTVHVRGIGGLLSFAVDPQWRFLIAQTVYDIRRIPLDGGAPTVLDDLFLGSRPQLDPSGTSLACRHAEHHDTLVVVDLNTDDRVVVEAPGEGALTWYIFDGAGRLLMTRGGVVSRWDPRSRATEILVREGILFATPVMADSERIYLFRESSGTRSILDLGDGSEIQLASAYLPFSDMYSDAAASTVVSAHGDGELRVGRFDGEQPHLLLGHGLGNTSVWMSPNGKWIASVGVEGTILLWPTPDVDRPPLHTLPYRQLMAKLESLTNLRAVPDEESHTGYRIEADFSAYHGWAEVPEW